MRRLKRGSTATATALIVISTGSAYAAATRAEYVAQVDPICHAMVKPTLKAIGRYGKALSRKGATTPADLNRAGFAGPTFRFIADLEMVYAGVTTQIATVAPPPGDEPTIASWLQARETVRANLDRARRLAKHRKVRRANRLSGAAGWGKASYVVKDFGFQYCAPADGAIIEF